MSEVLSNTNVFYRCNGNSSSINHQKHHHHQHGNGNSSSINHQKHHHHQHGRKVSVIPSSKLTNISLRSSSSSISNIYGRRVVIGAPNPNKGLNNITNRKDAAGASNAQMGIGIGKAQRWWEKGLKTNVKAVDGPQDLVESLLTAGDKLVVVDFFSPGCGGCKALHPKICQLAEMNPDVQFLQVNYEEHKPMCYALNVHVLPFFRFYRGAHGRLCSFSCTNATIKKFKDALAKHSPDRCSLGAPKGLDEKELVALSANKDLSFTYKPKPEQPATVQEQEKIFTAPAATSDSNSCPPLPLHRQSNTASKTVEEIKDKTLIPLGR